MLAAAAMGALLWLKASFVLPWVAAVGTLAQAAALGVLIAGGLIIYAALLILFGVVRPAAALDALRAPRGLRG
jgi:putative peptidoglycan lipid II flippase